MAAWEETSDIPQQSCTIPKHASWHHTLNPASPQAVSPLLCRENWRPLLITLWSATCRPWGWSACSDSPGSTQDGIFLAVGVPLLAPCHCTPCCSWRWAIGHETLRWSQPLGILLNGEANVEHSLSTWTYSVCKPTNQKTALSKRTHSLISYSLSSPPPPSTDHWSHYVTERASILDGLQSKTDIFRKIGNRKPVLLKMWLHILKLCEWKLFSKSFFILVRCLEVDDIFIAMKCSLLAALIGLK